MLTLLLASHILYAYVLTIDYVEGARIIEFLEEVGLMELIKDIRYALAGQLVG